MANTQQEAKHFGSERSAVLADQVSLPLLSSKQGIKFQYFRTIAKSRVRRYHQYMETTMTTNSLRLSLMRVTRKDLEYRVERLNVVLNRPKAAWTRIPADAGKVNMRANIGHFLLETNSPGDGWTRYTLSMIISEGGGEINVSPCCTLQEMWSFLAGVFSVLDSQFMCDGAKHTFDKYEVQS